MLDDEDFYIKIKVICYKVYHFKIVRIIPYKVYVQIIFGQIHYTLTFTEFYVVFPFRAFEELWVQVTTVRLWVVCRHRVRVPRKV